MPMLEAFVKIVPVLLMFLVGYILKRTKTFKEEDGGLLLKLVFFVASPALTYVSVSKLDITPTFMVFPLIAAVTMFSVYAMDLLISRGFKVPQKTLGVYFIGTLIANTGFSLPFLLATHGVDVAARVSMYDLAGGILTYIFVYSLAVRYGDKRPSPNFIMKKILIAPPVWALILALVANFSGFQTPVFVDTFLKSLGNLVSPLIMLALGLYFSPKLYFPKLVTLGVLTRMAGGLLVGYILSSLFGLHGIDRAVVLVCTGSPIGFNTLTFSNLEDLDTKFAASIVSIGVAVGLIVIPLLTALLH